MWKQFQKCIFQTHFTNSYHEQTCKISLKLVLPNLIDDKSTLVQVMAWCRQAKVDPGVCHHMASLGHNELTH